MVKYKLLKSFIAGFIVLVAFTIIGVFAGYTQALVFNYPIIDNIIGWTSFTTTLGTASAIIVFVYSFLCFGEKGKKKEVKD